MRIERHRQVFIQDRILDQVPHVSHHCVIFSKALGADDVRWQHEANTVEEVSVFSELHAGQYRAELVTASQPNMIINSARLCSTHMEVGHQLFFGNLRNFHGDHSKASRYGVAQTLRNNQQRGTLCVV